MDCVKPSGNRDEVLPLLTQILCTMSRQPLIPFVKFRGQCDVQDTGGKYMPERPMSPAMEALSSKRKDEIYVLL